MGSFAQINERQLSLAHIGLQLRSKSMAHICRCPVAVIIKESGDTTLHFWLPSCQEECIDKESLLTGIQIPNAGHNSFTTARTASYKFVPSPGKFAVAIQFADKTTWEISSIDATAMLVMASPTAILADATGLIIARGARSSMAKACFLDNLQNYSLSLPHPPLALARAQPFDHARPPHRTITNSTIVIKKLLSATEG